MSGADRTDNGGGDRPMSPSEPLSRRRQGTRIAQGARFPLGCVETPVPPVTEATTVLFADIDAMAPVDRDSLSRQGHDPFDGFYYGAVGTPSSGALARMVAGAGGAGHAVITPAGLSAFIAALWACVKPGQRVLVSDAVTYSLRWHLDRRAALAGIGVDYFPPGIGAGIAGLIRPETRLVCVESPGAFTFEVEDLAPLAAAVHTAGIRLLVDDTWSAGLHCRPIDHGADLVLYSLAKLHAGIAGVSLGAVLTNDRALYEDILEETALQGMAVSADATQKASVACQTLAVRLAAQDRSIRRVMAAVSAMAPAGLRLLHPAIETHPGHAIWRRDFTGAGSLFSIVVEGGSPADAAAIGRGLALFRPGYGWGGAVSLLSPFVAGEGRTVSCPPVDGAGLRLYVGLEDADDLAEDLCAAVEQAARAGG
ncbi:aminotransferase class I/II-fold pyridoxal phosphate-dependent enzyme [Tistrella bauzanensis]|uniref:Aminotransferase class I/II-fold pyridoxal phosphate-dependent enzyme n=1 Tax=Tistrella arctica TaxID=3133430 RepID=A0ABU9YJG5_9PROT